MYAITGITGQVGGAVARALLAGGQNVRAIVRDPGKAEEWAAQGAEIAVADFNDRASLAAAFDGTEGVYAMLPANFAPDPDFTESRAIIHTLRQALASAKTNKVCFLSSVGAQHDHGLGLITQLYLLEQEMHNLSIPSAFIRPGWFMENSNGDIPVVRASQQLPAFLQPLDRAFPMVATEDIGRAIANVLQQEWSGNRVVEIEGPKRYSQNDLAEIFGSLMGTQVQANAVPRDQWAAQFEAQGAAPNVLGPRIEMLDGFNSGWIDFEGQGAEHIVGKRTMEEVLTAALSKS